MLKCKEQDTKKQRKSIGAKAEHKILVKLNPENKNLELTAKMKKSSCIHETAPKFEYLNTRSITHITLSAKFGLE